MTKIFGIFFFILISINLILAQDQPTPSQPPPPTFEPTSAPIDPSNYNYDFWASNFFFQLSSGLTGVEIKRMHDIYHNERMNVNLCISKINNGICVGWAETEFWYNYPIAANKSSDWVPAEEDMVTICFDYGISFSGTINHNLCKVCNRIQACFDGKADSTFHHYYIVKDPDNDQGNMHFSAKLKIERIIASNNLNINIESFCLILFLTITFF